MNGTGILRCGNRQEEASIKKGVRMGCSLPPCLFNLYVQEAVDRIREETRLGVGYKSRGKVYMLKFADGIAAVSYTHLDVYKRQVQ